MFFKHSALFLAAAAILLAAGTSSANSPLCAKSKYPDVCNHIAEGKSTPADAAATAIDLLVRKSIAAKALAYTLESHADAFSKKLLEVCRESYDDAVSSLQEAAAFLKKGSKNDVNRLLSAAGSNYVACNDGFLGEEDSPLGNGRGHPNPLSDINSHIFKLNSVALDLSVVI